MALRLASRAHLRAGLAMLLCVCAGAATPLESSLAALEARLKGRIGVFALKGPTSLGYRGGERFAYCSTFKWVLAATVLKRVDEGRLDLGRRVLYGERDLLEPCTLTRARLREGMNVGELCAAAVTASDNAAANLLEPLVGGPSGLQAFVRGLGDSVMRFDRIEPELNSNLPGDPRDTTSPEAMTRLLRNVLEGDALSKASRERLLTWMKATSTGARRIRAGVPRGWTVGDKTGTGGHGAANDVAVLFPPAGEPIYLCVFTEGPKDGLQEKTIAEATRMVLQELAPR